MNILFLLGNGFDINLDMNTRYSDFYESEIQILTSRSKVLKKLKNDISKNIQQWSDLELKLGNYAGSLTQAEDLIEIHEFLLQSLEKYLNKIESKINWESANIDLFKKSLLTPENALPDEERIRIEDFKSSFFGENWDIDIFTFNYTKSVELILKDDWDNVELHRNSQYSGIYLRGIHHIHGYKNSMVLGVNDAGQIKNETFKRNSRLLKTIVKPQFNVRTGSNKDNLLDQKINNSSIIIIFGCSIGETDAIWWDKIGKRLVTEELSIMLIFIKCNETLHTRRYNREDEMKIKFKTLSKLTEEEYAIIENRIIVRANTTLFSNLIPKP